MWCGTSMWPVPRAGLWRLLRNGCNGHGGRCTSWRVLGLVLYRTNSTVSRDLASHLRRETSRRRSNSREGLRAEGEDGSARCSHGKLTDRAGRAWGGRGARVRACECGRYAARLVGPEIFGPEIWISGREVGPRSGGRTSGRGVGPRGGRSDLGAGGRTSGGRSDLGSSGVRDCRGLWKLRAA